MDLPRPLSAEYKSDFAYVTVKDRLPVILTRVVDTVCRLKEEVSKSHGEDGIEELKSITGRFSKLKNEIQTDKEIVELQDNLDDDQLWSDFIDADRQLHGGKSSWFSSPWLFTECYFYRRIYESIQLSTNLKWIDPFEVQKKNALIQSMDAVRLLIEFLRKAPKSEELILKLLHVSLWGNKCDLSISSGLENSQKEDVLSQLNHLKEMIIVDESNQVLNVIRNKEQENIIIDIVLDNAGFELVTDLCFAEYLLMHNFATTIRFHGKRIPWFVSDVTKHDFSWTLATLLKDENIVVASMAKTWQQRLIDGSWVYTSSDFWTLPHDFAQMRNALPSLYEELSQADLVLFKGDLNYRKLVGDLKWKWTTSFEDSLRGFHPTALVTLRTLKCDLVVGLKDGQINEDDGTDWMLDGSRAVIQYCGARN